MLGWGDFCSSFRLLYFLRNPSLAALRDWWSFLAMVFVGQCEALVCLGFVEIISFLLFFPLAAKLIGPKTGCQFCKNVDFFDNHPLK